MQDTAGKPKEHILIGNFSVQIEREKIIAADIFLDEGEEALCIELVWCSQEPKSKKVSHDIEIDGRRLCDKAIKSDNESDKLLAEQLIKFFGGHAKTYVYKFSITNEKEADQAKEVAKHLQENVIPKNTIRPIDPDYKPQRIIELTRFMH